MALSRRFLYLVAGDMYYSRCCTLHRIDTSRLFYPDGSASASASASADRAANAVVDAPLPEHTMRFENSGSMQFSLLGRQKHKIVAVDDVGRGILYDAVSHSVRPLPTMAPSNSWRTLSVAVDGAKDHGSVYVLDAERVRVRRFPGPLLRPVQVLVYEEDDWVWRSLPPPPYMHGAGSQAVITSHAVDCQREGQASLLWVSTAGRGTHWLDTATHVWTKAGDWALPFQGQAASAPNLGFWLGFSAVDSGQICVSDLARAVGEERPPEAEQAWGGFEAPEGFYELYSHLVHLDGRRFCVAKVFEWTPRQDHLHCSCCSGPPSKDKDEDKCFALFTGVEVVHISAGRYRMVKHRSLRYCLGITSFEGCIL